MHIYALADTGGWESKQMSKIECSQSKPWGIHLSVRNDGDCPRCGWTAPGPRGDAAAAARALTLGGLVLIAGGAEAAEATEVRAAA